MLDYLNLFMIGLFTATHKWGKPKSLFPKICHTYPPMMKLSTVISYLKNVQKIYKHVTYSLKSADVSICSPEISKLCYIRNADKDFTVIQNF